DADGVLAQVQTQPRGVGRAGGGQVGEIKDRHGRALGPDGARVKAPVHHAPLIPADAGMSGEGNQTSSSPTGPPSFSMPRIERTSLRVNLSRTPRPPSSSLRKM